MPIANYEPTPETPQNQKSLFRRYFYFFQLADTQASPSLKK